MWFNSHASLEPGNSCIPLRLPHPKWGEIDLCPKQEIEVNGFAICRYLTDEIERAVLKHF